MIRLEVRFLAAKDGWTPESLDAMTDRLADAFPGLEARCPWLVDLDLAANLAAGELTVGVSVEGASEQPVVTTIAEAVLKHRGDVAFEYYQVGAAIDEVAALTPTESFWLPDFKP